MVPFHQLALTHHVAATTYRPANKKQSKRERSPGAEADGAAAPSTEKKKKKKKDKAAAASDSE